ncbi:hypothetical protein [Paenibacillus xerothermodurans]|uniref:Type II secretion system protein GspF domain-containing protein n=1 Tax=Paenibacillus xerothermodurans TaxID=1977292 RepID=A0A2W1NAJ1_PAEXE|nr:hypothetical protein [Paenibacillus xerothermodurans]PZE20690.1 hypothetical protein CBW46_010960 [Paenibacillus xerothermodurans]
MAEAYALLNTMALAAAALVFTSGLYLLLQPLVRHLRTVLRTERRHQIRMKELYTQSLRPRMPSRVAALAGWLQRELEMLLKATQRERYSDTSLQLFVLFTSSSALSVGLIAFFATIDARFSLFAGGLTFAIPIVYYRIKLRSLQIQNGYDLAEAVGILSSKYKVTRGNMRTALQLSCQEIGSAPIRRHFMNLIREELNYVDSREMEKAVEEFIYSIKTSFAKQLGLTVLKGLVRGENVESTLMAIDKNIHKQIDVLRDEGDSSSEILQLSWLHVLLFPSLLLMMAVFIGYNSTLHYQLGTEQGRFWFTVTVCFIVGALLLAVWFRRPPNDY